MKKPRENTSKLYMAKALIELMKTKALDDISITMLTRKAGVSRMSYYRYFSHKIEVLENYLDSLIETYYKEVDEKLSFEFQSREHIIQSLKYFKKHADLMLCLTRANLSPMMMERLNAYVFKRSGSGESKNRKYQLFYYMGAIYNVYIEWLKGGLKESESDIADIIYKFRPDMGKGALL